MDTRAIVVGTDGAQAGRAAIRRGAERAHATGGTLHLVAAYTLELPSPAGPPGRDLCRAEAQAALAEGCEVARELGITAVPHLARGSVTGNLRRLARRLGAQLIVVGTDGAGGGVGGTGGVLLGFQAACPVEVVDARGTGASASVADTGSPAAPPATTGAGAAPAPSADPRRPMKVLAVTTVAIFMALLDVTIVNTAFPAIRKDFSGTSFEDLSWILNAYNVAFAALLVPAGRLADRVGRRRMFYVGLGLFLAGSTACGLAPGAWWLVAARLVQAAGAAALVPAALGLALPEFAPERRAVAASVSAAAGAVAAATGPSLGGVLVDQFGWRSAFLVNLVIAMFIPLGAHLLVERKEEDAGTPDWTGGALLAVGTGAVALSIVKAPDWGWGSTPMLLVLAVGFALVGQVARRSRTHPSPVLEGELLRIRSFAVANASFFLFSMAFYALLLGNILFLTSVWQYTILQAGFAVTPGPLAAAPAAAIAGRLTERHGPRAVAVPATFAFALACLAYREAGGAEADYVHAWLPAQLLSGVAIGATFSALATGSILDLPADRFATGTSLQSCFRQLGAVLGIAVLVAVIGTPQVYDLLDVFHRAWLLEACAALGACVVAFGFGAQRLPRAQEAARPQVAARHDARFPRHEVLVHGHRVAYRQAGSGPVLVLLHGLFDESTTWRRVVEPLSREYTVIAPDLLGHGTSDAPGLVDYSLGGHAAIVRDLLDALGHRRVTVAGHSMGGGVAMWFFYCHPERVERLVLVSSGGLGRRVHPVLRVLATPGSAPMLAVVASPPVVRTLAWLGRHRMPVLEDVAQTLSRMSSRRSRRAAVATLRAVVEPGGQRVCALDRLALTADTPLLILWGGADRIIPVEHGIAGHELHPASRMVVLDGVGHLPHLTRAGAVADAILRFGRDTAPAEAWPARHGSAREQEVVG